MGCSCARRKPLSALVFIGLLASLLGCARELAPAGRALVIGVDGATNIVLAPMIAAGELPNLQAIARQGISTSLRPDGPLLSPRIWTSIATGSSPERHGIEGWVRLDETGRPRLYTSADRKVHAIWNMLSDAGRRVAVINWLVTQPPEKIDGVIVSDHAVPGIIVEQLRLASRFARAQFPDIQHKVKPGGELASFSFPAPWSTRLAELRAVEEPLTAVGNPFDEGSTLENNTIGRLSHFLWQSFENDTQVARVAIEVERELKPDLMLVYLPGIDRVSHFLWPSERPHQGDPKMGALVRARAPVHAEWLRTYYRHIDALIGLLAADFGKNDLVMVLSDHGFESGVRPESMPGIHESEAARDGVLYARGPRLPSGRTVEALGMIDIAPTLLAWFGMPTARDMGGTPGYFLKVEALEPIASYDTTSIERVSDAPSEAEAAVIEQLRTLGYVE